MLSQLTTVEMASTRIELRYWQLPSICEKKKSTTRKCRSEASVTSVGSHCRPERGAREASIIAKRLLFLKRGNRTPNPALRRRMLFPLSYRSDTLGACDRGLEPIRGC